MVINGKSIDVEGGESKGSDKTECTGQSELFL